LVRKGFEDSAAAAAIQGLSEERFLDDIRYAGNYVSYHAARGEGPLRIGHDLKSCGLPDDLIAAALTQGPDWRLLAREVRIRRFGAEEPSSFAQKARQARFLQYRGFSSDHIRSALGADFDLD
jgi:regulatory protein